MQKREFFRVEMAVKFSFIILRFESNQFKKSKPYYTYISNISGNGFLFIMPPKLVINDQDFIFGNIILANTKNIPVLAKKVRLIEDHNHPVMATQILEINPSDQDIMIKILNKQIISKK